MNENKRSFQNMEKQELVAENVLQIMLQKDRFTKWLGIKVDACAKGACKLHFRVTEDMLNGFDIIHGGVLFSACDSALAFACNSHGIQSLALDANVSFVRQVRLGEVIAVEAK